MPKHLLPAFGPRPLDRVRLSLATSCRRNEIVRRREVDGVVLELADDETLPRKVFLNAQARTIVERRPRTKRPYVFSSLRAKPQWCDFTLWREAKKRAVDVRIYGARSPDGTKAAAQVATT